MITRIFKWHIIKRFIAFSSLCCLIISLVINIMLQWYKHVEILHKLLNVKKEKREKKQTEYKNTKSLLIEVIRKVQKNTKARKTYKNETKKKQEEKGAIFKGVQYFTTYILIQFMQCVVINILLKLDFLTRRQNSRRYKYNK